METALQPEPVTAESSPPRSPLSRLLHRARIASWWTVAAPWLMGGVVALALYLAWFTYDLLQNQLHESSAKFNVATRRFERYSTLYDATVESALALKWDLSTPSGLPDANAFAADIRRFELSSGALQKVIGEPGPLLLAQGTCYEAATQRLSAALAQVGDGEITPRIGAARTEAQAVLERLALVGQEARQRQSLSAVFRDEVDEVRKQVLMAFSGIVAVLVLVVAVAAQWVMVARRERAIRGRAEHLAEVAEAERARAENVVHDKSRFLGMLSHELMTPLQSIWSTMDVIESRGRVDAHDPVFTRLKESTRSLRGRISDLVDFAKMSSGRLEMRIRGFQLDKLIDSALRDAAESLAAKNLDVHWEAGPELSRRVYSDPARLRQIIDNILSNAVKYTDRGGITITAQLQEASSSLSIEIADTGVGISPEDLTRLFEPFYRSPVTASMAEGSGLGLAVVRSVVNVMGGAIQINSCPGQGTTVLIEVPVAEAIDGGVEAPSRIDVQLPVLVVDDSRDARRAIADVIRSLGLDVYEAGSGSMGLTEAAERDYQAIILDMQMPDLSGYDVALQLRKAGSRQRRTFMILVSAFNDLDQATCAGVFDARIDKPASRKDLMDALACAALARR